MADFDSHDIIDSDNYGNHDDDNFDGIKFTDTTDSDMEEVILEDPETITVTFDEEIDNLYDIDIDDFKVTVEGESVDIYDVDTDDGITFILNLTMKSEDMT